MTVIVDLDMLFALAPIAGGAGYLVLEGLAALWEYWRG